MSEPVALLPFLPMIYVAWADGSLTPDEILRIRTAADQAQWLDAPARAALDRWLDPARPPSARILAQLRRDMEEVARRVPEGDRQNVVALGRELARAAQADHKWDIEHVSAVLTEAARALYGVMGGGVMGGGVMGGGVMGGGALGALPAVPPLRTEMPAVVAELQAALDGSYADVKHAVRALLEDSTFRFTEVSDTERYRAHVLGWVKEIAARGFGAKAYPKVLKQSADLGEFIAVFETLAHFDLSLVVKAGVQFGLFGGAIYNLGTARHHALLERIATAELLGCFAMTERAHGSNVRELRTVARYEPSRKAFIVTSPDLGAGKEWIGGAARDARLAVVFAQLETQGEQFGVHAFLVPVRSDAGEMLPGVRSEDCGHKMGLNGVDNGRLWFDNVEVPRDNLLDRFGQVSESGEYASEIASSSKRFFTMLGTLVGGRISVSAGAVSAAKTGLTIAVRYGEARRQFAEAGTQEIVLMDYLTHQRRLIPRIASAYAFSFAQQHLVASYVGANDAAEAPGGHHGRDTEALAAGMKALSTWNTIETLQACRESCGGQGYLSANRIDALRVDTDVFTTFEGDNTVLLELVAKSVLGAYNKQFAEDGLLMVLRELAVKAATSVTELNPVATHKTDGLRDFEFHVHAFRFRERSLTGSAARRLKKRVDAGMDPTAAFNSLLDHMLALAQAHVERVVLEQFQARAEDGVLRELCALWALWRIESDLGWFLENGYVAPVRSRAIREEVTALCGALRPSVRTLTDAFAIPAGCLGPLADAKFLTDSGLAQP